MLYNTDLVTYIQAESFHHEQLPPTPAMLWQVQRTISQEKQPLQLSEDPSSCS